MHGACEIRNRGPVSTAAAPTTCATAGPADCCARVQAASPKPRERRGGWPCSRALAVNGTRALLVVLLLREPELLEGAERRQDRSADPDGEAALGGRCRGDHLDLHRGLRHDLAEPRLQPVGEAREQRAAAAHDDPAPQLAAHVGVARADAVGHHLGQPELPVRHGGGERVALRRGGGRAVRGAEQARREEELGQVEPLPGEVDRRPVRQLVLPRGRLERCPLCRRGGREAADALLGLAQQGELRVAEVGRVRAGEVGAARRLERVERPQRRRRLAALQRGEHELCDPVPSKGRAAQRLVEHVPVVDCDGGRLAATHVEDEGRPPPGGEGGEHRRLREEQRRRAELLKQQLRHLLARGGRVEGGLGHQDWMLRRGRAQAALVRVRDERLGRVPVGDDPVS
mmetsp:Transcript_49286/g.163220  ORF Transcript_49286/g.163220 Transcript_49286/m.163220 type:complete len:400 (-) Transcript_49286:237-1436(-)